MLLVYFSSQLATEFCLFILSRLLCVLHKELQLSRDTGLDFTVLSPFISRRKHHELFSLELVSTIECVRDELKCESWAVNIFSCSKSFLFPSWHGRILKKYDKFSWNLQICCLWNTFSASLKNFVSCLCGQFCVFEFEWESKPPTNDEKCREHLAFPMAAVDIWTFCDVLSESRENGENKKSETSQSISVSDLDVLLSFTKSSNI